MKKIFTAIYLLSMTWAAQAQWQKVEVTGLPASAGISKVFVSANEMLAGSVGQMFRSTDQGQTWADASTGIQSPISGVTGIVKLGNRTYASFGGNGNYYVHYIEDGSSSWSLDTANWPVFSVMGNKLRFFARQLITHKNEYIIGVLESNFIVYKKPADSAWGNLTVPSSHRTPDAIFSSGDTLYLVKASGLVYSTDLGASWSTRSFTPQLPGIMSAVFKNSSSNRIYAGASEFAAPSKDALFYSDNNGASWDSLPLKSVSIGKIAEVLADGNELYVALQATLTQGDTLKKVLHSTDGGQNWTDITADMYSHLSFKFHSVTSMLKVNGTLYASVSAGPGLLKYGGGNPIGMADGPKMLQTDVYPNPASSSITFELDDVVNVLVSDLKGQTTTLPVYGRSVDVSALPAGLYLMQIESRSGMYFAKWMKQ